MEPRFECPECGSERHSESYYRWDFPPFLLEVTCVCEACGYEWTDSYGFDPAED